MGKGNRGPQPVMSKAAQKLSNQVAAFPFSAPSWAKGHSTVLRRGLNMRTWPHGWAWAVDLTLSQVHRDSPILSRMSGSPCPALP